MPPIDAAQEPDDLRAQISAALDSEVGTDTNAASGSDAPSHEPATQGAAEVDSSPSGSAAPTNKADHPDDPARYADGTFKPTKSDTAPAATAATEQPSKDTQAKASDPPASTPADAPPAGWTAEAKAEWNNLSPAVKAAALKREADISNGGRQWSEEKRRYEAVLSPVAQEAQRLGMRTDEALNALMTAHHRLNQDAPAAIRMLAQQYGVDLATLAAGSPASGSQGTNPDIAALVRQAVQPILAPLQERFAAEDTHRQQSVVDTVTSFASSPGHEHFDSVSDELMAMIPTIKAANPSWNHGQVLQDAYDRAVYANPTTRAAVLAADHARSEAKRSEDARQRAAKARTAGSSVTGSPSSASATSAPKDSLRAEIEAAFAGSA